MSPIPFMDWFIHWCVHSLSSIRLSPCLENVLCLRVILLSGFPVLVNVSVSEVSVFDC